MTTMVASRTLNTTNPFSALEKMELMLLSWSMEEMMIGTENEHAVLKKNKKTIFYITLPSQLCRVGLLCDI